MIEIITKFKLFMNDISPIKIYSMCGDDEFNKNEFKKILDDNKIKNYFFISSNIHIVKKWNP